MLLSSKQFFNFQFECSKEKYVKQRRQHNFLICLLLVLDLPSNPPEEVSVEEYRDLIHLVAGDLPVKQVFDII